MSGQPLRQDRRRDRSSRFGGGQVGAVAVSDGDEGFHGGHGEPLPPGVDPEDDLVDLRDFFRRAGAVETAYLGVDLLRSLLAGILQHFFDVLDEIHLGQRGETGVQLVEVAPASLAEGVEDPLAPFCDSRTAGVSQDGHEVHAVFDVLLDVSPVALRDLHDLCRRGHAVSSVALVLRIGLRPGGPQESDLARLVGGRRGDALQELRKSLHVVGNQSVDDDEERRIRILPFRVVEEQLLPEIHDTVEPHGALGDLDRGFGHGLERACELPEQGLRCRLQHALVVFGARFARVPVREEIGRDDARGRTPALGLPAKIPQDVDRRRGLAEAVAAGKDDERLARRLGRGPVDEGVVLGDPLARALYDGILVGVKGPLPGRDRVAGGADLGAVEA
ncbi:hypothetical protein VTK73DRAFT_666 [Phialemonium thermophilum]|uniref:Uncharacterized protein n=1 Tax=Phialemonium thermophilum TaxID=223376 RepID=A0ABR3VUH0_9PEZI